MMKMCHALLPKFVFAIADRHLKKEDRLKRLKWENQSRALGNYAFRMCYSMKEIILPQTVMSLGRVCLRIAGLLKGHHYQKEQIVDDEMLLTVTLLSRFFCQIALKQSR